MTHPKVTKCKNCGCDQFEVEASVIYYVVDGRLEMHRTENISETLNCSGCQKEYSFDDFDLEE